MGGTIMHSKDMIFRSCFAFSHIHVFDKMRSLKNEALTNIRI